MGTAAVFAWQHFLRLQGYKSRKCILLYFRLFAAHQLCKNLPVVKGNL